MLIILGRKKEICRRFQYARGRKVSIGTPCVHFQCGGRGPVT